MRDWLEGFLDPRYVPAALWALGVLAGLIILYLVYRLVRALRSGGLGGGRGRRSRLGVMDAASVDGRRQLVLVRRDDVEHLLLIGGPTDIVVEQNIRMVARMARPQGPQEAPVAGSPPAPPPAPPGPPPSQLRPERAMPAARPAMPPPPRAELRPAPADARNAGYVARNPARPAAPTVATAEEDLDSALLHELQDSLANADAPAVRPAGGKNASLEEEMTRLLGQLSRDRKP